MSHWILAYTVLISTAPSPHIYGGVPSATCQWPTTVGLLVGADELCSGTLVDPNVVVYAAHCGTQITEIDFGEGISGSTTAPARRVVPTLCRVYPNHDPYNGTDFAYCLLPNPVVDVPVVPILMGCETAALRPGKSVVLAGFGADENNVSGIKRQVTTVQDDLSGNKAFIGGNGDDTCFGDSGGPAFLSLTVSDGLPGLADGSWRVYGITSYTPSSTCGPGGYDSLLYLAVPWIEADSGIDITPCTDADGTWHPSPACKGFPLHPDALGASWANGCGSAEVGGYAATCGPAYNPAPPQVSIVTPSAQTSLALNAPLAITVQVVGNSANVAATYDGTALALDTDGSEPPLYTFTTVPLALGSHTIVATVADAAGYGSQATQQFTVHAAPVIGDPNALSSHGAGCAAAPPAWMTLGAVLVILLRHRRVRLALFTATVAIGIMSCAVTPPPPDAPEPVLNPNISVDADQNNNFVPADPNSAPVNTAVTNAITGSVGGYTFTPKSALFAYVQPSDATQQPFMALILSDQPGYCAALQANSDRANGRNVLFLLTNGGNANDVPTQGTYPVDNPNASPAGPYANAAFTVNDATCTNILNTVQANATSGTLTISTHILPTGAVLTGTFSQVVFSSTSDAISGTFSATDCDLSTLNSTQPSQCN